MKTTIYRTALIAAATALGGSFLTVALAQQNPFSGLMNSIQALGNSLHDAQAAGAAAHQPVAPASAVSGTVANGKNPMDDGSPAFRVLRFYANDYHRLTHESGTEYSRVGNITSAGLESACAKVPDAYSQANRNEQAISVSTAAAISGLLTSADTIAACASDAENPPSSEPNLDTLFVPRPRVPLKKAYTDVGQLLATTVIASQSAGVADGQTALNARNAVILLRTDAAANKPTIDKLIATGLVPELAASDKGSDVIHMTAKQAVSAYKSNSFGFNTKYSGKQLQITGPIENISGSGQSATVELEGYMPANPQDQGFQDMVLCQVGAPSQLQRVGGLSKGQTVTVQGLYNSNTPYAMGVTLLNCSIRR